MIDATINAIMNAPPSDPRAGSASVRDDAKGGSFGDALSTVRDERRRRRCIRGISRTRTRLKSSRHRLIARRKRWMSRSSGPQPF